MSLTSSSSMSSISAPEDKEARLGHTGSRRADFAVTPASAEARHIADWVVDSGDNHGLPFVIIDKANAKVFVFAPNGRLAGSAPALLGLARGDHTVSGIGERELSTIRPEERTTPAGRFAAERGRNFHGEDIVWVDYDAAVSMHKVRAGNPKDRRLKRLSSPTPADNRITYGCINLPVKFYNNVLAPAFTGNDGVVYVLPERRSLRKVFGSYDVTERRREQTAGITLRLEPRADSLASR